MQGLHLTADLHHCRCDVAWLTNAASLGEHCLAESHLCIHTWPTQSAVTRDVYVCNFGGDHSGKAHALMDSQVTLFNAKRIRRHSLSRGEIS